MSKLLATILLALVAVIFFYLLGNAIDRSIDNQNVMLCESAKVSKNAQYLSKCQTYYETGDIKYLRTK